MVTGIGFALFSNNRLEKIPQYHQLTNETSFLTKKKNAGLARKMDFLLPSVLSKGN